MRTVCAQRIALWFLSASCLGMIFVFCCSDWPVGRCYTCGDLYLANGESRSKRLSIRCWELARSRCILISGSFAVTNITRCFQEGLSDSVPFVRQLWIVGISCDWGYTFLGYLSHYAFSIDSKRVCIEVDDIARPCHFDEKLARSAISCRCLMHGPTRSSNGRPPFTTVARELIRDPNASI